MKKIRFEIGAQFVLVLLFFVVSCGVKKVDSLSSAPWEGIKKVMESVQEPSFKNTTYDVLDYGALANGVFDNTIAFKKAIETCSQNGGGIVLVPDGNYLCGPIHLENNVNFHLSEGTQLLFSTNTKDYPLVQTSFEGTELINYSPFIYAKNKHNIAVTGKGTLNGQSSNDNWWAWSGKDTYGWKKGNPSQADPLNRLRLVAMAEEGVAVSDRVFGEGHYIRPNFIEFFECTDVLLKDVRILDVPCWVIHPMKSTNVIVDGVSIRSHGPNNDGCDPEYSKNVFIRNCTFDTGDDCIAIKSGRDADGRRVAIKSENIVVQNCKMFDGHGGVTIGSEISAGVRNVFVENCMMNSPNLEIAIRLKTNSKRGGLIENFFVRNIEIGQVKETVLGIDMFYSVHGNQTGKFIPVVRNIFLENISVNNGGKYGILAKGLESSPIKNIVFKNVTIAKVETKYSIENVENLSFESTKINGSFVESPKK